MSGSRVAPAQSPPALDPSEEMTPEELATIPDPVPAGTAPSGAADGLSGSRGGDIPPAADLSPGGPGERQEGISGPAEASGSVWRIQVFASPDRAQADRVSREAAARLGAGAIVEREGGLFKVRLGEFASEAEAQALRDRAVRQGYPGAFRVLGKPGASNDG